MGVTLSFICFGLLSTFPRWREEVDVDTGEVQIRKRAPSKRVCQIALWAMFLAALLELATILWQHTASVAAATITSEMAYDTITTRVGAAAMTLGWIAVSLLILAFFRLLLFVFPLQAVNEELVEENDG